MGTIYNKSTSWRDQGRKNNSYDILAIWVNYNSMHIIETAKQSLLSVDISTRNTRVNIDLVIVDNNSQDGSYEVLKKFREKLELKTIIVRTKRNWGFAGGANLGYMLREKIREKEYDFLLLLNNDAVLIKNSLPKLAMILEETGYAGIQGVIHNPRGGIDNWGYLVDELLVSHPIKIVGSSAVHPTYLSGAYSLYSMNAIEKCIGKKRLFFEYLPAYFDDKILGLRLWNCGYKLVAIPIESAIHLHGATFSRYSLYHIYNAVLSYTASLYTTRTRYRKILWLVLLKNILRLVAKSRELGTKLVGTITRALREGAYYGNSLKEKGLVLDLYKAPYIAIEAEDIPKILAKPKIGLNQLLILDTIKQYIEEY